MDGNTVVSKTFEEFFDRLILGRDMEMLERKNLVWYIPVVELYLADDGTVKSDPVTGKISSINSANYCARAVRTHPEMVNSVTLGIRLFLNVTVNGKKYEPHEKYKFLDIQEGELRSNYGGADRHANNTMFRDDDKKSTATS